MKNIKFASFGFLVLLVFAIGAFAQELPAQEPATDAPIDAGIRGDSPKSPADTFVKTLELASISSTASGGLWSAPSTWVGGVVPGAGDNVTIAPGAAVVIDTAAEVASLTIGDATLTPAVLTFDPGTARSLKVNGDLNIQNAVAMLTTPSTGTITDHTLTVGGNLTNNGVLDLSTNSNQAGANLVFINSSSNTFGGNGPTNDVRAITMNKGLIGSTVLTVSVANFTVQGSTNDTSGYLTVTAGTFKISGTFSGNHRTFATANYAIPTAGGFWLDNANYNVAPQNGTATVSGLLQVTSGTMNIGTTASDGLFVTMNNLLLPWVLFEGGTLNISGGFKSDVPLSPIFMQTGGAMHVCTAGSVGRCLGSIQGTSVGGDIYIQNARPVPDANNPDYVGNLNVPVGLAPSVVHFGTATTPPGARFTASGALPNVILDTATGPHTLTLVGSSPNSVGDINIGPGGTWDMGAASLKMTGNTFINNGAINAHDTSAVSLYCGDGAFSGTGSFSGALNSIYIQCNNLTFAPTVGGIRARNVSLNAHLFNSNKLTIGNNDSLPSSLSMMYIGSLDTSPVYDLGTGGMKLTFDHTEIYTAGPEIPPSRNLNGLICEECVGPISFPGGDLTVNGEVKVGAVLFDMGNNRLIHTAGPFTRTTGWVHGTLVRKFTGASQTYNFFVGDTHLTPVFLQTAAPTTNPAFVSVKPIDAPLAGIPAATTLSHSWQIEQTGTMTTSALRLSYGDEDVVGSENSYKIWRNSPQLPLLYSTSQTSTAQNFTAVSTPTLLASLTGTWGIGAGIPTITISGRITTSNGSGIGNATVMLTGGSLSAPRLVQTGPFGTYNFFVDPGGEYTVTASAKRHRFGTMERVISTWSSVADVDFTANPPE